MTPDAQGIQRFGVSGFGAAVDGAKVFLAPDFGNADRSQGLDQLACIPASPAFHAAGVKCRQRAVQRMPAAGLDSESRIDTQEERRAGPVNALLRALVPHVRAETSQRPAPTAAIGFSAPETGQQFLPRLALGNDA